MLSEALQEKLKKNWGEKADALECYAEVRLHVPGTKIELYLLAINPDTQYTEEEILVLSPLFEETAIMTWEDIENIHGVHGEELQIDEEYRPKIAKYLIKRD